MSDSLQTFFRQNRSIILSYVATFVLLIAVSVFRPGFGLGSVDGMRSLLVEASVIAIVSLGQTLVILSGGIDLSLPWTLAGTAVMMTVLTEGQNAPLIWVVPLLLVGCLVIGFINGALITYLDVSPVIVTLAMGSILLGAVSGIGIGSSGVIFGTTPAFISVCPVAAFSVCQPGVGHDRPCDDSDYRPVVLQIWSPSVCDWDESSSFPLFGLGCPTGHHRHLHAERVPGRGRGNFSRRSIRARLSGHG